MTDHQARMASRRTPHYCHADHCETRVPPAMFMCKRHWYTLTKAMRDEVWDVYVPDQENNWDLVTDEYLEVTRRCIAYVAEKEATR